MLYFDNRFATSERQWIEAQVENAKQQAILSILKAFLMLINAIVNDLEAKEFINNTKPSQSILFQTTLTGKL